jgi:RNA polymerase sigma-70 factor, ECF subfamily
MPKSSAYQMTRISPLAQQEAVNLEVRFEHLVGEYYPYIYRLAISILDDLHDAEDAAQETFVAAHRSLTGFRDEAHPKTWLTAIAINVCRGRLRKRKVRLALISTLQSLHLIKHSPSTPEQSAIQSEADLSIWQAVDNLDDKHRIPVIMRYVHEMTVPDIARTLHLSQGTIHSRLHYARQKLHDRLEHLNTCQEVPDDASE